MPPFLAKHQKKKTIHLPQKKKTASKNIKENPFPPFQTHHSPLPSLRLRLGRKHRRAKALHGHGGMAGGGHLGGLRRGRCLFVCFFFKKGFFGFFRFCCFGFFWVLLFWFTCFWFCCFGIWFCCFGVLFVWFCFFGLKVGKVLLLLSSQIPTLKSFKKYCKAKFWFSGPLKANQVLCSCF